jgi:hypothetical protein
MSLSHEVRRIKERLSERVAELKAQPRPPRVEWCARLLGEDHPRARQLAASPNDPALVTEYRLDQLIERPHAWDQRRESVLRAVAIRLDADDPPPPGPDYHNLMFDYDERFPRLWIAAVFAQFGPPLLVHNRRPPTSWAEGFWAAGESPEHDQVDDDEAEVIADITIPHTNRGPRLFLACIADECKAIRVHDDGLVESRVFGASWEVAGRVPQPTSI